VDTRARVDLAELDDSESELAVGEGTSSVEDTMGSDMVRRGTSRRA
jgi:hypothetical protein